MTTEYNLSELLLDEAQGWQVHNCKLIKNDCHRQGTLPFIYHYDRLSAELKQQFPLTRQLLANFNQPMTATQACQLIGIDNNSIANPFFVKITGSIVIFCEPLQLALRLHWSNTAKNEDAIYCQSEQQAIGQAIKKWQFIGRVDTLYRLSSKNAPQIIGGYDKFAKSEEESYYILPVADNYQFMPYRFAGQLLTEINHYLEKFVWVRQTIVDRIS